MGKKNRGKNNKASNSEPEDKQSVVNQAMEPIVGHNPQEEEAEVPSTPETRREDQSAPGTNRSTHSMRYETLYPNIIDEEENIDFYVPPPSQTPSKDSVAQDAGLADIYQDARSPVVAGSVPSIFYQHEDQRESGEDVPEERAESTAAVQGSPVRSALSFPTMDNGDDNDDNDHANDTSGDTSLEEHSGLLDRHASLLLTDQVSYVKSVSPRTAVQLGYSEVFYTQLVGILALQPLPSFLALVKHTWVEIIQSRLRQKQKQQSWSQTVSAITLLISYSLHVFLLALITRIAWNVLCLWTRLWLFWAFLPLRMGERCVRFLFHELTHRTQKKRDAKAAGGALNQNFVVVMNNP